MERVRVSVVMVELRSVHDTRLNLAIDCQINVEDPFIHGRLVDRGADLETFTLVGIPGEVQIDRFAGTVASTRTRAHPNCIPPGLRKLAAAIRIHDCGVGMP